MTPDTHLTNIARGLARDGVAAAVARQRLISCTTDHPAAPLRDCVQVARAIGLSMTEVQRTTGVARQTLYRHATVDEGKLRTPPHPQATIELLLLAAAEEHRASLGLLARRAGLSLQTMHAVAQAASYDDLCDVAPGDYGGGLEVEANDRTLGILREHFDELYLRRPDTISVYVHVDPEIRRQIEEAAAELLPPLEHVVIDKRVAPSVMVGPELAFSVNAPTIRRALEITTEVWFTLLDHQTLDRFTPAIANVIPPGGKAIAQTLSLVLDAFLEHAIDAGAQDAQDLREIRAGYDGSLTEADLSSRALTMAALALRRAVGNKSEPRPIKNGDEAFAEWEPAHSVATTEEAVPVKKAAVAALDLAIERLGPIPGGRLGSFRHPDHEPKVVETVEPSTSDLVTMAELAGAAVGAASAISVLSASAALRRIVSGESR